MSDEAAVIFKRLGTSSTIDAIQYVLQNSAQQDDSGSSLPHTKLAEVAHVYSPAIDALKAVCQRQLPSAIKLQHPWQDVSKTQPIYLAQFQEFWESPAAFGWREQQHLLFALLRDDFTAFSRQFSSSGKTAQEPSVPIDQLSEFLRSLYYISHEARAPLKTALHIQPAATARKETSEKAKSSNVVDEKGPASQPTVADHKYNATNTSDNKDKPKEPATEVPTTPGWLSWSEFVTRLVATPEARAVLMTIRADWHARFISASAVANDKRRTELITKISTDFVRAAGTYGRIIIQELFFGQRQTLGKSDLGGIAGGDKFVINSILFKLNQDKVIGEDDGVKLHLYGTHKASTENAMKAAALEVKAAAQVAEILNSSKGTLGGIHIHVPTFVLIDHCGYRLLAMPIMPISKSTLVYGSGDGGRTIYKESKAAAAAEELANRVGLCAHKISNTDVTLHLAGDVEVHLGLDKHYHIVDLGRFYPPESPSATTHLQSAAQTVFYRLLRPEIFGLARVHSELFMKRASADSYSPWGGPDNETQHNPVVTKITEMMLKAVGILARSLVEQRAKGRAISDIAAGLRAMMHVRGINMRHLGLLRQHVLNVDPSKPRERLGLMAEEDPAGRAAYHEDEARSAIEKVEFAAKSKDSKPIVADMVMCDMLARTLKNLLRSQVRNAHKIRLSDPSLFELKQLIITFLNSLCEESNEAQQRWADVHSEVCLRFGKNALTGIEPQDLFKHITVSRFSAMTLYILDATAVRLNPTCRDRLTSAVQEEHKANRLVLHEADIESIDIRVKYISAIDKARAKYLENSAADAYSGITSAILPRTAESDAAERLQKQAGEAYRAALHGSPADYESLAGIVSSRYFQLLHERRVDEAEQYVLNELEDAAQTAITNFRPLDNFVKPVAEHLYKAWNARKARNALEIAGGASSTAILHRLEAVCPIWHSGYGGDEGMQVPAEYRKEATAKFAVAKEAFQAARRTDQQLFNLTRAVPYAKDAPKVKYPWPSGESLVPYMRHGNDVLAYLCNCYEVPHEVAKELLEAAVVQNQAALVDFLLLRYVHPDTPLSSGRTVLSVAAAHAHLATLDVIKDHHPNLDLFDSSHKNAVMHAVTSGYYEGLKWLLDAKASPSLVGPDQRSALYMVNKENKSWSQCVRVLVEAKCSLYSRDTNGNTPILAAAKTGKLGIAKPLIEFLDQRDYGTTVNKANNIGLTPLMAACAGEAALVSYLIAQKANVNLKDLDKSDALLYAAKAGSADVVAVLLEAKASVETQDAEGGTALYRAAETGSDKVLQLLLKAHANPNQATNNKRTPFSMLAARGTLEGFRLLLEHKADASSASADGKSVLFRCAEQNRSEILELLIEHKADIAKEADYMTPLAAACSTGSLEAVNILLKHKADVNRVVPVEAKHQKGLNRLKLPKHAGYSCLMNAAASGSEPVMKTLIEAKTLPNYRSFEGIDALSLAIRKGSIPCLQLLLSSKACDLEAECEGKSPLVHAVLAKNDEIVKLLLAAKANVNARNKERQTALHSAIGSSLSTVKILIEAKAMIEPDQKPEMVTPVQCAVAAKDPEYLRLLLKAGAKIEATSGNGENAITAVFTREGTIENLKILMEAKADVTKQYGSFGTPLMLAVQTGAVEQAALLLAARADPLYKCDGETILLKAASMEDNPPSVAMMKLLLETKIDVNAKDQAGRTILSKVVSTGPVEVVKMLLLAKADLDARDNQNFTPLCHALAHQDIWELLIDEGAAVNINTNQGTLLRMAIQRGTVDLLDKLVYFKADVNFPDAQGQTPLFDAGSLRIDGAVRYLIQAKANLEHRDEDGDTPLLFTEMCGEAYTIRTARALIDAKADVNARNKRGVTPLHKAVLLYEIEAMNNLIAAKADVNAKDNRGETPLLACLGPKSQAGDPEQRAEQLLEAKASVVFDSGVLDANTAALLANSKSSKDIVKLLIGHHATKQPGPEEAEAAAGSLKARKIEDSQEKGC